MIVSTEFLDAPSGAVADVVADEMLDAVLTADSGARVPGRRFPAHRMTLRQRLVAFGTIGTILTAIVVHSAITGLWRVERANAAVGRISKAQGYFQDGDMMHDALRADVYAAILVKSNLDSEGSTEVQHELAAHADEFRFDLAQERALHLRGPVEKVLDRLQTPLATYIARAEQIAQLAFTDRAAAVASLEPFEAAFEDLAQGQVAVTRELDRARQLGQAELQHAERWAKLRIVSASVLALAGLIVLVVMLLRLARPIARLAVSAERLGGGDFSVRVAEVGLTEIDDVANALNSTAQRLGDLVARERAFSSNASHQLRTPVTALRIRLEHALATRSSMDAGGLESSLEVLDHLEGTVEHLLALARDVPVARGELDVSGVLRDVARIYEPNAAASRRQIRVVEDDRLPVALASEAAVTQILTVLVSNAMEHGTGTVTVRSRDAGCGVAIEVSDEGPGIDGHIERIFARRAPSPNGRGLGLPLARSLAEAEGARLSLHHRGARPTFTLMLPTAEPAEA